MTEKYHPKSKTATQSFSQFCDNEPRRFPPIPAASNIRPARRAYFSLPRPIYEHSVADLALEAVAQHARNVVDPRELYLDNEDWLRRGGRTLKRCDAVFILTFPDCALAAGSHAEAAYAHALGLPVHVITWRLDGEPRIRLGGGIVTLKAWHWWRAARYRPKKAERAADKERDEAADAEFAHVLSIRAVEGEIDSQFPNPDSRTQRTRQRPSRTQRIDWRARHRRRALRVGEAA